jgi:FO synthase
MEETISRMAGSDHGSRRDAAALESMAASVGRMPRQRTTTYGIVDGERRDAVRAAARRIPVDLLAR